MPLTRQQRRQRRRTRLTLLASALVVAVAGIAALYYVQKNRQQGPLLDPAPRDAAVAMVQRGAYDQALTAFAPYLEAGQTPPDALAAWAQARVNVPLPDGAHVAPAVQALRSVLKTDPHHTNAAEQLLAVLSRYPSGVENEIIKVADRVLQRDPENTDAQRARALGFASQKRYGDAARTLDTYLLQHPDDLQMQRLALDMMRGERQPDTAVLARAQRAAETSEDPALARLVQAHAQLITGDRAAARNSLAAAVSQAPENPSHAMQVVQMLDAAGLHAAVKPFMERCLAAAETGAPQTELVTELALRRFEFGEAQASLDLLDRDDAVKSLYLDCVRAIALHTLGRNAEAADHILTLTNHATNRYRAAGALLQAAFPRDGAASDAQSITDAAPGLSEHAVRVAYLDAIVAEAHQRQGQTAEAQTAYRAALRQRPAWAGPCLGLAELFLQTGDHPQAQRFAQAAGQREGGSLRVAVMTARAAGARARELTSDQLVELSTLIDRVQSTQPGEATTTVLRVEVLALQGKIQEAADAARRAAQAQPPLSENALLQLSAAARRYDLGVTDELQAAYTDRFGQTTRMAMAQATATADGGDPERAVASFDSAIPEDPDSTWRVNRALLYERVGHPDTLTRWAEATESDPGNARVQARALTSVTVWSDRTLVDRTIKRLQAANPEGLVWRTERARFLLTDPAINDNPTATALTVERLLAQVGQSDPSPLNVLVMRATARRLKDDPQGAAQLLEQALLQAPNDANLQLELAQSRAASGDHDGALDTARTLTRRDDLLPPAQRSVAYLLRNLGDVAAATTGFQTLHAAGHTQPADLIALARLHQKQQRFTAAAALLPELLAGLGTDDPQAKADGLVFAAGVYADAGLPQEADRALERLDELELSFGRRQTLRATHHASRGQLEQAERGFAAAAEADPSNPAVWRNLIEYRLRAGQRDGALDAAQQAVETGGASPGVASLHAQRRLIKRLPNDPGLASLFSTLIGQDDARPGVLEALQILDHQRDGSPDQRAEALAQLADNQPQIEALQVLAVNALRQAGRFDAALTRASAGADRFAQSADLAQARARGHAEQRNWTQTLIAVDAWRARLPGNTLAADTLAAQAHRHLGRPERAIQVLAPYRDRILNRPEITPVLTRQYAILLAMAGRAEEARSVLTPLLDADDSSRFWRMSWLDVAVQGVRDTRDAGAWLQQVENTLDQGQLDERAAIAQAWWALGLRDNHPPFLERARTRLGNLAAAPNVTADVWFFLGTIAEHDGDPTTAAQHYRKSLTLAPGATNTRNNLAMVLASDPQATAEQLAEAVGLATAITRERPNDPNLLDTRAAVLLAAQRHDEALTDIRQAIELDPGNPDWRRRESEILTNQSAPNTP